MTRRSLTGAGLLLAVVISFACVHDAQASQVCVKKDSQGDWTLRIDGEPFFVRGMSYIVNPVGQSPDGMWMDWAWSDENHNGKIDGPYDAFVDKNGNNRQDPNEPSVGDFQLMKEMGVNTIRWYQNAYPNQRANKELFRDLYTRFGIRVAVGYYFGAYCIGSGASWEAGTDYRNTSQKQRMLASVRKMVLEHKDEPYTLLWILGNENNYPFTQTNAGKYPVDYAKFLNEAADTIHQIDDKHPVAFVNGAEDLITYYAKYATQIDIFGTNCYKGSSGFGVLWKTLKPVYDKPVLITEYGANLGVDDQGQAQWHLGNWNDIRRNRAGGEGAGNAIGGIAFEWLDRWWVASDPWHQAERGDAHGLGATSWNQEYGGFFSQGDGGLSPFLRRPRKVYFDYRDELWKREKK